MDLKSLSQRVVGILLALAAVAGSLVWADDPDQWRWSDVERVVSIGDVHGAYESVTRLLDATGLVSDELNWVGGTTHLVMLGDLVDRGPRSRDVMDLLMRLQKTAPVTGGRVHVVLGNHEVMNLLGDYRYVSNEEFAAFADEEDPKDRAAAFDRLYGDLPDNSQVRQAAREQFDQDFPPGYFAHRRAFSPDGIYGRWLLDLPIVVVINNIAYMHGGLAPCLAEIDPDEINERARLEMVQFLEAQKILVDGGVLIPETRYSQKYAVANQYLRRVNPGPSPQTMRRHKAAETLVKLAKSALVTRSDGPLWYRGSSLNPVEKEDVVATRILEHLDAEKVVVGHTPNHTGRVSIRMDGKVVRADTGMLTSHYKGQPAAVIQQNGLLLAFYPGQVAVALSQTAVEGSGEAAVSAGDLEMALREADVVSIEEVGTGSSRPFLLTLAHEGELYRGVFKTNSSEKTESADSGSLPSGRESHRYQHEIAAYQVSSMLGLDLVPVTVGREINGESGSLQLWVENAINETNLEDADLRPPDLEAFERQEQLASVFDVLILNMDRDPTSVLVTTTDWRLRLIDQSQAFAALTDPVAILPDGNLQVDPEFAERLRSLDEETLRPALRDLLDDEQIDALIARRDLILAAGS